MLRLRLLGGISALAITMAASPLHAQSASEDPAGNESAAAESDDEGQDGVILVTAQRRESELQETPIAITALGNAALEARGIDTAADLAMFVPGANITTNGGATSITIRGVGSDGLAQPKDDPSVAAHLDGVYLTRPASLSALLYDIERIEVLRGPQGTLYGRNATGGALNVITKQPTDRFEAQGDATIGNYDAFQLRGVINVPLAREAKFRGSVIYNKHDGYSTQLNPAFEDGDDADDFGGRATLLLEPTANFSVTLRASIFQSNGAGPSRNLMDTQELIGVRDANGVPYGSSTGAIFVNRCALPGFPEACTNNRAIHTVFPEEQAIKSDTYSATLDLDLSDSISVKSITAYTDFSQGKKTSSRPFRPLDLNATFDFITTSRAFTQEVSANYDDGGPLTLVAGAFYLHDKGENFFDNLAANPMRVASISSDQISKTESVAAFGEANYEVAHGVTLTAGIRYTSDKKAGSSTTVVRIPFGPTLNVPFANEAEFDSTDFKLGASWEITEDLFAYLNYSTAFKTGGVNTGIPVNATYDAEKLKAWQGGLRSDWLGGNLRVNLDGYYYKYRNPQITQVLGTSLETQNGSSATVKGAELSIEARPLPGLFLGGQISYADSEYGPGRITDIIDLSPFGQNVFGQLEIGGNELRFTPEWTAGANASYTLPLSDSVEATARADYFWQATSYARPHNLPIDVVDEFSLLNASLRFDVNDGRYFVEVFGKNLLDEEIVSARFVNPLNLVEYRAPRTYGVTVGFAY